MSHTPYLPLSSSTKPIASPAVDTVNFALSGQGLVAVSQFVGLTLDVVTLAKILNGDLRTWPGGQMWPAGVRLVWRTSSPSEAPITGTTLSHHTLSLHSFCTHFQYYIFFSNS